MGRPVVHWELMSKDPARVAGFYEKIFGRRNQHFPEMNYRLVKPAKPAASTLAS
jgi:predicted enzyme related to lactoylglutathione lyase